MPDKRRRVVGELASEEDGDSRGDLRRVCARGKDTGKFDLSMGCGEKREI